MTQNNLSNMTTPGSPAVKEYNVYLYVTARVKVTGILASSQVAAIQAVEALVDLNRVVDRDAPAPKVAYIAYADEITYAVVDEVGDTDFIHSKGYEPAPHDGWTECKDS